MTDTPKTAPSLFAIRFQRPLLVARFAAPQRMVSWSLNRPGFVEADEVAWLEVRNTDLTTDCDPVDWFRDRLEAAHLSQAVGMMTSRDVTHHHFAMRQVEDAQACCLVTLGLNNGECVGARFPLTAFSTGAVEQTSAEDNKAGRIGTVNILVAVNLPLTDAALLEASSIVVQARTRAILDIGFRRPGNDEAVSGTGTDCVVMASPLALPQAQNPYAGLHTAMGEAIGAATRAAVQEAGTVWMADPRRFSF